MSNIEQTIIRGPSVQKVAKREDAEAMLKNDPRFPKGAAVTLIPVDGHWSAVIAKIAGPPPFEDEGSSESGDSPAPEGPPSGESEGSDSPPSDGGDKPKGEGKDKGGEKGGEAHMLTQIFDMLSQVTQALGIAGPDAGMGMGAPGMDGPPMGPPPGPPMGGPGDGKTHTVHERALKPGETPPGGTPVGTAAFASTKVPANHPWAHHIANGAKEIEVDDELGNDQISDVAQELNALGNPFGYQIDQIVPFEHEGSRRVAARLVRR